ncbi:MAG: tyrosine-type recombinase/integrase [Planctomycetaceae bacterium]|nr:tyrosine-type recombinase/integrase [Planctomycetaceae bacterium]
MKNADEFPALLQRFFTDYLAEQRRASSHTIAAYRDTFRLLLGFAHQKLKTAPSTLRLDNLTSKFITEFLAHLERERNCSFRTRNARLAAVRSFFRYVSFQRPDRAESIRQIIATPFKRGEQPLICYLTVSEIDALLAAPDLSTWFGRRDHALLQFAVQTGLRVSELTGVRIQDVHLESGPHVRCLGKGRKERSVPLTKESVATIKQWLRDVNTQTHAPLFPNRTGSRLSSDSVQHLLRKHVKTATMSVPTLRKKRVTPHVLRHTTAVQLLHAGVEQSVIALWLGHESYQTTQVYLDADLEFKEKVLAAVPGGKARLNRFQPTDRLLAFLSDL